MKPMTRRLITKALAVLNTLYMLSYLSNFDKIEDGRYTVIFTAAFIASLVYVGIFVAMMEDV